LLRAGKFGSRVLHPPNKFKMKNFKEKFYVILIDKLKVNQDELTPEKLFYDLGANSLDMVELIIDFEKAFDITIPDEDAEKIMTINDAENYLKSKLNIRYD
jgi:acyl carrier protein